jgi:adenylate cyclase
MTQRLQRKLAAIVAMDIAGYSRLVGDDEEGTLSALRSHREGLTDPLIAEFGGRIANTAGDSILAEFTSAVEAVRCAVAIQEGMDERNKLVPQNRQLRFRIGVNVGDVVQNGNDLLGDGVNVAARIEALASIGGICLSRSARDQVRDRLDLQFDDLGEIEVKNIDRPVRVFSIATSVVPALNATTQKRSTREPELHFPSIAVLPFKNLSGDPEQEYFADGIFEDIITELSRFPDIIVIARTSAYPHKGSGEKPEEISQKLGARYLLEGSVRKGGNKVRITAQLVDGRTGHHIWAERYDRDLVDIFDVQDEITQTVVANVPSRIASAELNRVKRKPPNELSAYDFVLRGKLHHHKYTSEDNAEALRLLDAAIACDPDYASAYAWKACTLGQALGLGCGGTPDELIERNLDAVHKGLSLDENDIECHRILAEFGMFYGDWDDAELHHAKAFQLNPNDSRIITQRGELFTKLGQAEEGLAWLLKANQCDPLSAPGRAHLLARANFAARKYQEALNFYKQIPKPRPDHLAEIAACYSKLDQAELSDTYVERTLADKPEFSVKDYLSRQKWKQPADLDHWREKLHGTRLPK